ncbi:MAG: tetratricopeptide repeat protein [Aestuariivirgaceae bacterium]
MSDESLFREVDDEVRRDEMEKLWKRYGNLVIAACVGVILGVAGIKGWQYWQKQASETAGAAYVEATKLATEGKAEAAAGEYAKLASGSHAGYAQLARLQQAGLLVEKGQTDDAVKMYDEIAADTSVDGALRDLSKMRAAYLLADTASVDDLKKRLAGLDVEGSAWRASSQEIIALAEFRAGNLDEADKLVKGLIADPNTPAGLRQRAQLFAAILKPQLDAKAAQ